MLRGVRKAGIIACACLLVCSAVWAAKGFVLPKAEHANTYASKDAHPNENVTIALDLYNTAPKDEIFSTHYSENGILPVFLIISNDGDQPIAVNSMRAQLVTSSRTKLEPLDPQDVFRRVANIHASSTNPGRVGPLPIPKSTRNKKAEQQFEEVSRARFAAAAVEPHSTQSGFLFFDVAGISQPVAGAHLYVTGVRDGSGNDLMYFEIPLIPANAASPGGL